MLSDDAKLDAKVCTKCRSSKPLHDFHKDKRRGGNRPRCKSCTNKENWEWKNKNAERHKEINDNWYRANAARRNRKSREWQDANPEKVKTYQAKWLSDNPERAKEVKRKADLKKRSTPKGKLENNIKAAVNRGLKHGAKNGRHTFEILGYSINCLRVHLEAKFQDGMTWENYGKWHVDHIIPLAAHNYESPDDMDFKHAWALSNLQPLWAAENQSKKDRLSKPFQPSLLIAANDNQQITTPPQHLGVTTHGSIRPKI